MPIIDQSDVIVADRVVLAVIDDHRAIFNVDVDRARKAKNEKRARALQNVQAYDFLSEMTADQRRELAISHIIKIAKEDDCEIEMGYRLNKVQENFLYDIIDNSFKAKLTRLLEIKDKFEENE